MSPCGGTIFQKKICKSARDRAYVSVFIHLVLHALRVCTEAYDWSVPARIRSINHMMFWPGFGPAGEAKKKRA